MCNKDYLAQAIKDSPDGAVCGLCDNENDFVDDCGFFWVFTESNPSGIPVCHKCWDAGGYKTAER